MVQDAHEMSQPAVTVSAASSLGAEPSGVRAQRVQPTMGCHRQWQEGKETAQTSKPRTWV